MNAKARKWRSDAGGVDFIQVVVGLMIISIAAVGTLQALYYGYEQLDYQMRYRKAVALGRAYVEYIQGRIHVELPTSGPEFFAGNLQSPNRWVLDRRDPRSDLDDIFCAVSYGGLIRVDDPQTGVGVDLYQFVVNVKWWEPGEPGSIPPHEINFHASMVESSI